MVTPAYRWTRNRDDLLPQVYAPPKKVSQEQSGDPQDSKCAKSALALNVSRLYTDENPAREISKVLEYSPCNTKHIRAESSRARRCINFMGVLYASPNNPDKEYAGKGKASPTERLLDALTRDNKCNGCMALGGP